MVFAAGSSTISKLLSRGHVAQAGQVVFGLSGFKEHLRGLGFSEAHINAIVSQANNGAFSQQDANNNTYWVLEDDLYVEARTGEQARALKRKYENEKKVGKPETVIVLDSEAEQPEGFVEFIGDVSRIIPFSQVGLVVGNVIGQRISSGDPLKNVVLSTAIGTILQEVGSKIDDAVGNAGAGLSGLREFIKSGSPFVDGLLANGVGALSSLMTAELVNALGVEGFAGELSNTVGGVVIGQIAFNIASGADVFADIDNLANIKNAVGGFLGAKLASELVSFNTIGGQIGSSVGSALAVIAMGRLFEAGTLLGGPVGAAIGAFAGYILGGLLGSLFGGTPRSGADVVWDPASGSFSVANVYSKKGGSKEAARGVAQAVADAYNGVLSAVGGELFSPESVQAGNYGMRKSAFVYRPVSSRDKDEITRKFTGKDAANKLIAYGLHEGFSDPDFQIAGGDIYLKRAFYNTFASENLDGADFDINVLLGNIDAARSYASLLRNAVAVNALIVSNPESAFSLEASITLARALELGLTRRHQADWYGGFNYLIEQISIMPSDVKFSFEVDPYTNKISRIIDFVEFFIGDNIDVSGQDLIEGTSSNDIITFLGENLLGFVDKA